MIGYVKGIFDYAKGNFLDGDEALPRSWIRAGKLVTFSIEFESVTDNNTEQAGGGSRLLEICKMIKNAPGVKELDKVTFDEKFYGLFLNYWIKG